MTRLSCTKTNTAIGPHFWSNVSIALLGTNAGVVAFVVKWRSLALFSGSSKMMSAAKNLFPILKSM